jgi:predicted nucleotidyltransferase component of viral defense system
MKQYQKDRIGLMKKILPLFGDKFVLKGGTSLMLYYGLNRYSEDIDLDAIDEMDITKYLKNPGYETWNIRIAKDTPTVFRVMLDYGAKSDLGNYPLKIEVSSRNRNFLNKNLFEINKINGVKVYNIKEIINMKVSTFAQRDKIRDLYDLGFLLKKYPQYFNEDKLKLIMENMQYKGLENLSLLLKDEFKNHDLNVDLSTDDYVLNMYLKCEKLLVDIKSRELLKNKENEDDLEIE